ncbi:MAG: hypothetical protein LBM77_12015 [Spirochaetaceae bacterium]|jgi:hypothetical protein|nr:hypothetical protein [Spirochaetaceae bacterium]
MRKKRELILYLGFLCMILCIYSCDNLGAMLTKTSVSLPYPPLSGTVSISPGSGIGTGSVLRADLSGMHLGEGPEYSYQWEVSTDGGATYAYISKANGQSLQVPGTIALGAYIRVSVRLEGFRGEVISEPVEVTDSPNPDPGGGTVYQISLEADEAGDGDISYVEWVPRWAKADDADVDIIFTMKEAYEDYVVGDHKEDDVDVMDTTKGIVSVNGTTDDNWTWDYWSQTLTIHKMPGNNIIITVKIVDLKNGINVDL